MNAAILTIGSELLMPGAVDTHSDYLIEKLTSVGIEVSSRMTVGDDRSGIAEAARHLLGQADIVVATGGLGPTSDDVTREGFADALDLELTIDEALVEGIRRRFDRLGREMPEVNRRQAMVPRGAKVLANKVGTAPGLWLEWDSGGSGRKQIVLLPGPPHEMHSMFETDVLPRLARQKGGGMVIRTKRLFVAGLPESSVEGAITGLYRNVSNPRTSLLASGGQVEIRLTARARAPERADRRNDELASKFRAALGDHVFSEDGETLEEVVAAMLAPSGRTLAVAESCTGGLITHRLTQVPGSSSYLERGFVTYSDESKVELLGVDRELLRVHGAVSEPVARMMARGARQRAGTDIGLAVTGIAGPGGARPEKPVGLVFIGLADEAGEHVQRHLLPGGRSRVKQWAAQLALNLLRLRLLAPPQGRKG